MTDDARIRELMLVNLFAVFSERDPERRLKVIAANYTEDVIWSDPEATTRGHEEFNVPEQPPRSAAATWRRYATDGLPCCTRW